MLTSLIPARGGSKRVPFKNIQLLGNKPLIDWSIDFSLSSDYIEKSIVSTDSPEVVAKSAHLSKFLDSFLKAQQGELIQISSDLFLQKRLPHYASDDSKTFELVENLIELHGLSTESLILLQPTSPFRKTIEIEEILDLKRGTGANSIFSVKRVESPHPRKTFKVSLDSKPELDQNLINALQTPAHQLSDFFAPDGAYYLVTKEHLILNKSLISADSRCLIRTGHKTINIDNEIDLSFARYMIETKCI